ncbi:hypothetical protein FRC17_010445 [Serendipita sp. 399]|nr:hypothetical protein FRC17_010445 [Serendipita sp. 399]
MIPRTGAFPSGGACEGLIVDCIRVQLSISSSWFDDGYIREPVRPPIRILEGGLADGPVRLAFGYPQLSEDGVVLTMATWGEVDPDQKISLKQNEAGVRTFTRPPVEGTKDAVSVDNLTEENQDLALGFVSDPGMPPIPVMLFDSVGGRGPVRTVGFRLCYIPYEQGDVLREKIETPAIWSANMTKLKEYTTLFFSRNPTTGTYSLKQALTV